MCLRIDSLAFKIESKRLGSLAFKGFITSVPGSGPQVCPEAAQSKERSMNRLLMPVGISVAVQHLFFSVLVSQKIHQFDFFCSVTDAATEYATVLFVSGLFFGLV